MCSPASPSPAQTQTQVSELPEWAKPYAKDVMAKGQALTDVNQNPYQTYNAPRVAGFTPMQEQAFQGAAGLGPSQAGLAGQQIGLGASLGAMNTGRFGTRQAQQYMNPYIEASLAPQMELMRRQQAQQGLQMAGQATQAGAFGGSRYGLAQVQQNLANQLAQQNLVGQGYNTAYQQAAQQYNADQARRLQGLSTALQGAGQLGQLGAQQFGQEVEANKLQSGYGAMQQAQQQKGLDVAYQDFLNQQNYPYKQLGFMSDLIRGLPLGQQSTRQLYDVGPSGLQTLGALGAGAYGLSKFMAKGGVTSEENVKSIADMLPTQQLPVSYQNALARGDGNAGDALNAEMMERQAAQNASLQRGLGMAFDFLSPEQQENVYRAAGGGIVAFARGGANEDDEYDGVDESADQTMSGSDGSPGMPGAQGQIMQYYLSALNRLQNRPGFVSLTPAQRQAAIQADITEQLKYAGQSPYDAFQKKLEGYEAERGKGLEQQKGLAALAAIPAILQGGNALRGLGAGAATFGAGYGKAVEADRQERMALDKMQLNLADAQRKEKMGQFKEAREAQRAAEKNRLDAYMAGIKVDQAAASSGARGLQATRPAAQKNAPQIKLNEQLAAAEIRFEQDPTAENEKIVKGLRRAAAQVKTSDIGPTKAAIDVFRIVSAADSDIEKTVKSAKFQDPDWLSAYEKSDVQGMAAAEDRLTRQQNAQRRATPPDGSAQQKSTNPTNPKVIKIPD